MTKRPFFPCLQCKVGVLLWPGGIKRDHISSHLRQLKIWAKCANTSVFWQYRTAIPKAGEQARGALGLFPGAASGAGRLQCRDGKARWGLLLPAELQKWSRESREAAAGEGRAAWGSRSQSFRRSPWSILLSNDPHLHVRKLPQAGEVSTREAQRAVSRAQKAKNNGDDQSQNHSDKLFD